MRMKPPFFALTVWTLATFACPAPAQDAPAEPREKKAAGKKAEGKSAEEGKVGAAPELEIPWDGNKLKGRAQIVKRLYRLKKTGQWSADRLPHLCQLCLETNDPALKMYATWYEALIAGHEKNDALARQKFKEAVELGYQNATEMNEAEELAQIREDDEVQTIIAGLAKKLAERMVRNYQQGIDANLKASGAEPRKPWGAGITSLGGEPLVPAGKPSVVVLARIQHDPLEQQIPQLKRIQEKAPLAVLFWQQYPPADPQGLEPTKGYLASLQRRFDFTAPAGVIGRKEYLELRAILREQFDRAAGAKERAEDEDKEVFREGLPFIVVLSSSGVPVVSTQGVQADWQINYLIQKIGELPAATPETPPAPPEQPTTPPKEETKPAPPAPSDPAAEKKPETTPPPPDNDKSKAKPVDPPKPADSPKPSEKPPEPPKPEEKPPEPPKTDAGK